MRPDEIAAAVMREIQKAGHVVAAAGENFPPPPVEDETTPDAPPRRPPAPKRPRSDDDCSADFVLTPGSVSVVSSV
jgi:hypothetical protein